MANYLPLVIVSGTTTELPPGDTAVGLTLGSVTAGSGLSGGGSLAAPTRLDVNLAANPSGLIFVGGQLADDGAAFRAGSAALASGNAALSNLETALASGTESIPISASAIASGNAVYPILASTASEGVVKPFIASSPIISGAPVGVDDANQVQTIRFYKDAFALTNGTYGPTAFMSGNLTLTDVTYHQQQDSFLISYRNDSVSNYGFSQVAKINGNYITYGTPAVFNSTTTSYIDSIYSVDAEKVILCYNSLASVVSVSGFTINFGAGSNFAGASSPSTRDLCYHERDKTIFFSYNVGSRPRGTVATVVGNTLNYGDTDVPISTDFIGAGIANAYDASSERLYVTFDELYTNTGKGFLVNTSGTSILSFTSSVDFGAADIDEINTCYDASAGKLLTIYNSSNLYPYTTKLIVASVSGNTLTYGPPQSITPRGLVTFASVIHDPAYSRNILSYKMNNTYETTREPLVTSVFTISGDYIDQTSRLEALGSYVVNSSYPYNSAIAVNTSGDALAVATAVASTSSGLAWVLQTPQKIAPTQNYYNNYLGVAQNTVSSGGTVFVRLPGSIDATNSNLTPGLSYYLSPATSGFTTNPNRPVAWSGQTPWDSVAKGVGSNRLLLTDSL